MAERTISACPLSAGYRWLAVVRLTAIGLLLILCLAHAAHDLPVPLALPFAICVLWMAFAVGHWALQRAARRPPDRPPPAEREPWPVYWNAPDGLSARAAHDLSTPISTMLLIVAELRRSHGAPSPDWNDSIDTLWVQLQLCKRGLNAATRPKDMPRRYVNSAPLENGRQR